MTKFKYPVIVYLKKEAEFAIENNALFWRPVGIQWNDERVKNAPKWEG